MEKETVDLILQLLGTLAGNIQQHDEKLIALERLLNDFPDMMWDTYQKHLASVQNSGDSEMNRESTLKALDDLRAKLLR
jgi:hypothetical protein